MAKKSKRRKSEKILLPGGCSMSQPAVNPSNWRQISASVSSPWYFTYRFFDPVRCPKGKQIMVKGMNDFKKPQERRHVTQRLLEDEIIMMKQGYNPAAQVWEKVTAPGDLGELIEDTPLPAALQIAYLNLKCAESTKGDIRSMLNWVPLAIQAIRLDGLPVGQVKEKHLLRILNKCSQINTRWDEKLNKTIACSWSVHKFNKYRAYLMILFKRIKRAGAIEVNPLKDMEKEEGKDVKKKRTVLTSKERTDVDKHLREKHPAFHRFMHIFFHSGARRTEMMLLQGKDVDLERQVFIRLVKKGSTYREVPTPIKDLALPFWQEAMKECGRQDYVFSHGFVPGPIAAKPERIARVWKSLVKDELGILADFYSLKHSNTTETAAIAGDQTAAEQNAHTTTAMVVNIYDVERTEREHARLRKVNNPFV